jgi:uncharacterized linocin/CFP29 family protein
MRYRVLVTNKSGVTHQECPTDDRPKAEEYARQAIEDGCRTAIVVLAKNGFTVSWWDIEEWERWTGLPG